MGGRLAFGRMEDFRVGAFVDGDARVSDDLHSAVQVCALYLELVLVSWEAKWLDVFSMVVLRRQDFKVHLMRRETGI